MRSPSADDFPGFVNISEPVQVQATIPESTVETLNNRVLGWFSRLNKVQLHAGLLAPEKHGLTGHFRPIVQNNRSRQSTLGFKFLQVTRQALSGGRRVHQLTDTRPGEIVDDVQDPKPAPIAQLIVDEVHGPALIHPGRNTHGNSGSNQLFPALGSHLHAELRVQTISALSIPHQPFRPQHRVEQGIPVSRIAFAQGLQPRLECFVVAVDRPIRHRLATDAREPTGAPQAKVVLRLEVAHQLAPG